MSHVSHKLSNAFQGALAGGGDPATSPLYVFGPFLRLLVVAGAVQISFGASIWLAVVTVIMVSAMYRLVMKWIIDGSGGSGLSEEEFGSWAVKINAGITVVEYTLTFLVSIAALVTFLADRFPMLNETMFGLQMRTTVAILLSIIIGYVVNRGPKTATLAFGPATAAVLLLLWSMIIATILKHGLRLPAINLEAFSKEYIHITLGGYARILALMTGIEIFANLVAAYDGNARQKSKKAFGSLLIIMGTTCLTMIIVGPAIRDLSDPINEHVSVFTQTMDSLFPATLAYIGTLIGVAVLLSAAAASAQGIQNLSLGLRYRHYLPAFLGKRNKFEVADKPVWFEIAIVVVCFLLFGTHEETYLALYAAGVFILLSLTGGASVKRLAREYRKIKRYRTLALLIGTTIAALLTTGATFVIFEERFKDGAWSYLVLIPILYFIFGYYRKRLGPPKKIENRLGMLISSSHRSDLLNASLYSGIAFRKILVPLDQTPFSEQGLVTAKYLSRAFDSELHLLAVVDETKNTMKKSQTYMEDVVEDLKDVEQTISYEVCQGDPIQKIVAAACDGKTDLIVLSTHTRSTLSHWMETSLTRKIAYETTPPLLVIRPTDDARSTRTRFRRLLVPLDGSEIAEQILPFVHGLAEQFDSEVILLSVPEGSESEGFSTTIQTYLDKISSELLKFGIPSRSMIKDASPSNGIIAAAKEEDIDLIMLSSHGRGGVDRQKYVKSGSVAQHVMFNTPSPLFLISSLPATQVIN